MSRRQAAGLPFVACRRRKPEAAAHLAGNDARELGRGRDRKYSHICAQVNAVAETGTANVVFG